MYRCSATLADGCVTFFLSSFHFLILFFTFLVVFDTSRLHGQLRCECEGANDCERHMCDV